MSGKYTPGPWECDRCEGTVYAINAPQERGGVQPLVALFNEFPSVYYGADDYSEQLANGVLISYSPSLLEKLESICTIAKENGGNIPYTEIKAAMELVAKAKGE